MPLPSPKTSATHQHTLVVAGAVVAVLITLAMALLGWRLHVKVNESLGWVAHTTSVARQFDGLLTTVTDAETAQRGFLLVGDEHYLAPYRTAAASVAAQLAALAQFTGGNPSQKARVGRLRELVRMKFAELGDTIALAARGDRPGAMALVLSHRGQMLMDEIRATVRDGVNAEEGLLAERTAILDRYMRRRGYLIWSLVALNAAGLAALILTGGRLSRLQPMVTVCRSSHTIKDGDEWITFEQYLERQYQVRISHGLSPAEAEKLMTKVEQAAVFHRR